MTITIVCVCGQHNLVFEHDLDTARCEACGTLLLKPAAAAENAEQESRVRA